MSGQIGSSPFEWAVDQAGYGLTDDGRIERRGGTLRTYDPNTAGSAYLTPREREALVRSRKRGSASEHYRTPMHTDYLRPPITRDHMGLPPREVPVSRERLIRLGAALRANVGAVPALQRLAVAVAAWASQDSPAIGSLEHENFEAAVEQVRTATQGKAPPGPKRPRGRPRLDTFYSVPTRPSALDAVAQELGAVLTDIQDSVETAVGVSQEEVALWLVNSHGFLGSPTRGPGVQSESLAYVTDALEELQKFSTALGFESVANTKADGDSESGKDPVPAVIDLFNGRAIPLLLDLRLGFDPSAANPIQMLVRPRCLLDWVWLQVVRDLTGHTVYKPCVSCGKLMRMDGAKQGPAPETCSDVCRKAKSRAKARDEKSRAEAAETILTSRW